MRVRQLEKSIDAVLQAIGQSTPDEILEAVWRDASRRAAAAAGAVAQAEATEPSTADDPLPPTTLRLRLPTAAYFRALGERLGISLQACLAMTLDGVVTRAIAGTSDSGGNTANVDATALATLTEKIQSQARFIAQLQEDLQRARDASFAGTIAHIRMWEAVLLYVGPDPSRFRREIEPTLGKEHTAHVMNHMFVLDNAPVSAETIQAIRLATNHGMDRW